MQLSLDERELALLSRVLQNYLPAFREEIYKTENFDWREDMKKDEIVLKGLIERLQKQGTSA